MKPRTSFADHGTSPHFPVQNFDFSPPSCIQSAQNKAMETDQEQRQSVVNSLPEVSEIKDAGLRRKVIDAWVYSLGRSSFRSIDEIRPSGNPDTPPLKSGTQTDHIRGVTQLSMALGDTLAKLFPQLPIKRDLLVACAL